MLGGIGRRELDEMFQRERAVAAGRLEEAEKRWRRQLGELEDRMQRRIAQGPAPQVNVAGSTVTLEEIVRRVLEEVKRYDEERMANLERTLREKIKSSLVSFDREDLNR